MARPVTVLAAHTWPSNAELIADVAELYLDRDMLALDPTYGRGVWWQRWRPHHLIARSRDDDPDFDFRNLPYEDGLFELAAFDPPYVSVGGRRTTGIEEMHDRYGLTDAPTSPRALQAHNNLGLSEVWRVLTPGGFALVKVQDYISSGRLWEGTRFTGNHAAMVGFETVDRFEHVSPSPRPQPSKNPDGTPRRQVHARRNLSTLLVLRKPKPRRCVTRCWSPKVNTVNDSTTEES
ncbi:MAG TPA: hypothetical protein VD926_04585 [Acidimicrobiales bacterium]|nr:hypothetical protein [Acidimicrobiales bacterium]